ncbi:MAG: hypothetical protein II936_07030, partial [Oscillospiraceae bacterium]|nr:hypothetical protein [Oscillospiraceae bacterium]
FKTLKDNSTKFNTVEVAKWAGYFLGKAKEYGIPCIIWDNNERLPGTIPFGIFNRDELSWKFDDVRQAIMKVYEEENTDEKNS